MAHGCWRSRVGRPPRRKARGTACVLYTCIWEREVIKKRSSPYGCKLQNSSGFVTPERAGPRTPQAQAAAASARLERRGHERSRNRKRSATRVRERPQAMPLTASARMGRGRGAAYYSVYRRGANASRTVGAVHRSVVHCLSVSYRSLGPRDPSSNTLHIAAKPRHQLLSCALLMRCPAAAPPSFHATYLHPPTSPGCEKLPPPSVRMTSSSPPLALDHNLHHRLVRYGSFHFRLCRHTRQHSSLDPARVYLFTACCAPLSE